MLVAEVEFVPVIYENASKDDFGRPLNWWQDASYFNHDWLLTSPAQNWGEKDVRKAAGIETDLHLLLDSGGFLLQSGHFPGEPKQSLNRGGLGPIGGPGTAMDVVDWYNATARRGDLCMILDIPPFIRRGSDRYNLEPELSADDFDLCLDKTKRNAEKMLARRNGDYDLFGVVQGRNLAEMERWFKTLDRLGGFDGWAFAPKRHLDRQVAAMVMAKEFCGKKPIHLLGLSGARAFSIGAYLAEKLGVRVTMDSAVHIQQARNQYWFFPGQLVDFGKFSDDKGAMTDLPCTCPPCEAHCASEYAGSSPYGTSLMVLHNLYQVKRYTRTVNAFRRDREMLITLAGNEGQEVRSAIDTFEFFQLAGYDRFRKRSGLIGPRFQPSQHSLRDYVDESGLCNFCLKNPIAGEPYEVEPGSFASLCAECKNKLVARDL